MSMTTTPLLRQRGVSLIVVMVMLLLGTVVVLGSTRVGWLNEKLVGNQSDYQRSFAAAEALMRDAENDILGIGPSCPGNECRSPVGGRPFFPQDLDDLEEVRILIGPNPCRDGICTPATVNTFTTATFTTNLATMTGVIGTSTATIAATYGQYTGRAPAAAGNPLLTGAGANAWYWIEVFPYNLGSNIVSQGPKPLSPIIYRINVVVQGQKPGSRVWLREVFWRQPGG